MTVEELKHLLAEYGAKLLKDEPYIASEDGNIAPSYHVHIEGYPIWRYLTLDEIPAWLKANKIPKIAPKHVDLPIIEPEVLDVLPPVGHHKSKKAD
jgi:hypothetical protein